MTYYEAKLVEHLEQIRRHAKACRDSQRTYFRERTNSSLSAAKVSEAKLDQLIDQYEAIANPQQSLV